MPSNNHPFVFDEFFSSGKEESISPFLTPTSRKWGKNLSLKTSILAAFLLLCAYILSFYFSSVSNVILLLVYFLVGTPALIDTIEDLKSFEINIDVLMTLAALLSVVIGSGFEGALLLVLFELSAAMENTVTQKTKGAISYLNQISPCKAYVISPSGEPWERSVKDVSIGSHILVKAGETVPLDAKVIGGRSLVNLSHLTGESVPLLKTIGDEVQAGAKNLDGTLTLEVLRTSADSTTSKIIELIEHAQEAKPKLQKFIDRFGDYYAISIMSLSFLFALCLPWIDTTLSYLGNEGAIYRALTFLIAASPCALVIATPTAYLSAITSCAKRGIILKGGIVLDSLSHCKTVAFDKTGTLTTGNLTCISFDPIYSEIETEMAMSIAASVERHVVHPIANALIDFAKSKGLIFHEIENFQSVAGFGVTASTQALGQQTAVFIGHFGYVKDNFSMVLKSSLKGYISPPPQEGRVLTYILIGNSLFRATFTDNIKENSAHVVQSLSNNLRMEIAMLTGDHKENADVVAAKTGISNVFADLRPEDKLNIVADLSKEKGLIMIGDGVNDAPALMRATVGISMGKIGSATAIDASDVVFLQDDLASIEWLIRKSHKTMSIIQQNLILALTVILFATTPSLMGFIPLWAAVILHEGGTVLVGLNSLRLLKK